jgi:hypothetical protein
VRSYTVNKSGEILFIFDHFSIVFCEISYLRQGIHIRLLLTDTKNMFGMHTTRVFIYCTDYKQHTNTNNIQIYRNIILLGWYQNVSLYTNIVKTFRPENFISLRPNTILLTEILGI